MNDQNNENLKRHRVAYLFLLESLAMTLTSPMSLRGFDLQGLSFDDLQKGVFECFETIRREYQICDDDEKNEDDSIGGR